VNNTEYFVFSKEGEFYRYKDFQLLDEGIYKKKYDNIYILKSDNIDEYIIYNNERFQFYDRSQNDVLTYLKIADHQLFINMKD
jgi:hypothetical protein